MPLAPSMVSHVLLPTLTTFHQRASGVGEAIRGTINTAADSALGSDTSKNQAIADRGIDEVNTGRYHGTGAGVTPADTHAERHNRAAQGEYPSNTAGTTGLGSSGPASLGTTTGSHRT